MFTLLSSILGFLSAGVPSVIQFFQDRNDKAHELEMMKIQSDRDVALAKENNAANQKLEETKLEEVNTKGFFDEKQALYANDAEIGKGASTWVTNLRASVRPVLTYGFFCIFVYIEIYSCYYAWNNSVKFEVLLEKIWSQDTQVIWSSIIAFWFGSRAFDKKQ